MSIYGSAVRKPVTTIMIFVGLITLGIYSLIQLPVDLFPEIELPAVTIMTSYPGANAADIETNISRPIENSLNTISNLKEVSSVSRDNVSIVTLEFEFGTDLDAAINEIRDAISFVEASLPDDANKPTILKFSSSMMPIAYYSFTAEESMEGIDKILNEKVIHPLNRVDGVGSILLTGVQKREISIEVDPVRLEAYHLTVEQIGSVLQAENMNMPAGNIKMGYLNYPLRIQGEFDRSDRIKNIVIGNFQGKPIFLKDVATVRDSLRTLSVDERRNGKTGVGMMIMKQSGANTVKIAKKVKQVLKTIQPTLPPDMEMTEIYDSSNFIISSINNLTKTLLFAFIFVILVILFFLGRWRATLIIVATIPISLIVAFIYLFISGNTINIIALSSLSIAIGMVVDDAIVVLENITKHIERGSNPREAAIYATNEVWLAVIVTTLTVVAVFFPLTLIGGLTGVIFKQLGWIVTITVITSTLTALTLTPMLSSKLMQLRPKKPKIPVLSHDRIIKPILDGIDRGYERIIEWSLHHKLFITIASFAIFFSTLLLATKIGAEFMPQSDEGRFSLTVELQTGTRVEQTVKVARQIEHIFDRDFPEIEYYSTTSGSDEEGGMLSIFRSTGSNIINMSVKLTDARKRSRSVFNIAEEVRHKLADIPEISTYKLTLGGSMMTTAQNNVDVDIYGYDLDQTTRIANQVADRIKTIKGAREVTISRGKAKPELQIILNQEKMAENRLNTAMVSMAIRNRVEGLTASQFREKGDEYNIIVRFPEKYRNSITDIQNIALMNPQGNTVRLGEIADVKEVWSPPNIERKRRQRVVTVSSVPFKISLNELAVSIQKEIDQMDTPSSIQMEVGGAYKDQMDSFKDLALLLLLSLVLVYLVMASQFESLKMPLIIMFSIPFAFSGVLLALYLTHTTLSVVAGLGAVLLVGIVVKNAIVLVDYINLMRDRGYPLDEAITRSARLRLRPVLMTAITTILGMLPLALSTGNGSEIWSPMGISVIGGLVFSTLITMILVPVMYRVFTRRGERKKKESYQTKYKFMDE